MALGKTLKDKYYSQNIYLIEWIMAALVGLLVFISVSYIDLRSLTIWSTNVWDATYEGSFRNLYQYTIEHPHEVTSPVMGSDIMSVLPWSIWNIPIWIAQRFFNVPILDTPLSLAWSKLFLVVLTVVLLKYAYKICYFLTESKEKSMMAAFLSASSVFTYVGVCYAGQNDIIMIVPSVMAVYYLLKGKKVAFYALSALSISIKPFYILPYLAIILLTEKNVLKIAGKAIIGVSGALIQKVIFYGAPMYSESMSNGPASTMLKEMFPKNIHVSMGPISFFAIALVLIYFYAYSRKFNKENTKINAIYYGKYVVYIVTITYLCYMMFSSFQFYRPLLLVPFLYITLMQNEKMFQYNIILEIAMSIGILMRVLLRQSPIFRIQSVNTSLFQGMVGKTCDVSTAEYIGVENFLTTKIGILPDLQPLISGVALVSAIMLIILNHPAEKLELPTSSNTIPRVVLWLRCLIIVPFTLLMLLLFLKAI